MRVSLRNDSEIETEAEVDRVGRGVRVSVYVAGTPSVTMRITVHADGAEDLARAILAVVKEVRAQISDDGGT